MISAYSDVKLFRLDMLTLSRNKVTIKVIMPVIIQVIHPIEVISKTTESSYLLP